MPQIRTTATPMFQETSSYNQLTISGGTAMTPQIELTAMAADAIGYIPETDLEQLSENIFRDAATGILYVQESEQVVCLSVEAS